MTASAPICVAVGSSGMLTIDAEAAQLKRQIADLVAATGTTLTDLHGIGPVVAARFIAEVVDVRRYPNRNAFAAANGSAPLPASSGRIVRHRFNPGGNRQMNRALTRSRSPRSAATPKAAPTTNANAAPERQNAKRCDASSGDCPTSCSPPCAATR